MKIFWAFFLTSLKSQASFRGAALLYFFLVLFHVGVALFLWLSASNQSFPQYTKSELIGYYIILISASWLMNLSMFSNVARDIKDGEILKDLVRPYSYFLGRLGVAAGFKMISFVFFIGGSYLIYKLFLWLGASVTIPSVSLTTAAFFILAALLAITITFTFRFVLGSLAFIFTEVQFFDYLYNTVHPFLSGDLMPVSFLPQIVQDVNRFLPFRYQLSFPLEVLLGKVSGTEMYLGFGMSLLWTIIMYVTYKVVWAKASRSYMAFGQ